MPLALRRVGVSLQHVDSERPEKVAVRVDEIPFPVVFHGVEAAGRLVFRAVRPAAEAIPGRGGRGLFQLGKLFLVILFQILVGVDLLRPVEVFVLTVFIDERKIVVAHAGDFPLDFRLSLQSQIREAAVDETGNFVRLERPLHFEFDRVDLRRVERPPDILAAVRSGEERGVRQIEPHRALFAGIQADAGVDLAQRQIHMARALAAVLAARDVHREAKLAVFGEVFDVHREIFGAGKVEEFPFRRIDPESGIPFRSIGIELDSPGIPFDFGVIPRFELVLVQLELSGRAEQPGECEQKHGEYCSVQFHKVTFLLLLPREFKPGSVF